MIILYFLLLSSALGISKNDEKQLLLQTGTMGGLGDELQPEVDRIKVSLKLQNKALVKELKQATAERSDNISELSSDIKTILDKMAYVTDAKMTKINERVQEHIYQTEAISLIIIMDQLDKKVQELAGIKAQIKQLKEKIPKLSDKCSKYFTCYDCLQDDNCGWCSMDDKCVEGDEKGPLKVSCNFYSYQQCNGRQCHKYKTCATCIADPSCGWCIDDDRYLSGCLQQPYDYQGCPKGGWHHLESRQSSCPAQLKKVYEEEFDENAYWSKPFDDSSFQDEGDSYEQDKNNALNGKGGLEETESKTEYNKKQQQVAKQIKDLEEMAKEVKKEIDALQKKYEETVKWLDKFKEKNGGGDEEEAQQEEPAQPEAQDENAQEEPAVDPKQEKKEAKAKKKEEKKQQAEEKKKNKEEDKKKAKEEKAKETEKKKQEEEKKKQKQKEEQEKKKETKKNEEEKRKKLQEENKQSNQEEEPAETEKQEATDAENTDEGNADSGENQNSQDNQQQEGLNGSNEQDENDSEAKSNSSSPKKSKENTNKSQQKKQKEKTGEESSDSKSASDKDQEQSNNREIPDDYFKEPQLQNKKWEDLYNGNFQFVQEVDVEDDELQFDDFDIVDNFYDPYHLD